MPGPPVASGAESEVSARSGKYGRQQAMNFTRQCGKAALSAAALAGGDRFAETPDRDAAAFGLVGEVGGDTGTREGDNADRHRIEHAVVALERRRLAVAIPVRLEGDLRHLAIVGPAGGD